MHCDFQGGNTVNQEIIMSFICIVQQQTISAAAKTLLASQSTISHRIQVLEQELGVTLFDRQRGFKKMTLTEDGKRFYPLAMQWLELNSQMHQIHSNSSAGKVRIGSMDSMNQYLLSPIFHKIKMDIPELQMEFVSYHSQEIYSRLTSQLMDVAFAFYPIRYDIQAKPVFIFITYPLVLLSELITKVFSPKNHQASVSREEVSAMVDVGTTEGIFRESESKIIKSCIRLAGVKAREVMTPSVVVESANVNLTIKEFYEQQTWNFSRIPVYDKNKDYIIGYVLKDMVLKQLSDDKFETKLSDMMRPILSFNEDDSVYQIWEKMLEKHEHISIILDEYGCLRGVVSMEDVIETMTGVEIVDEDDVAVDMQAFAKEKSRRMRA